MVIGMILGVCLRLNGVGTSPGLAGSAVAPAPIIRPAVNPVAYARRYAADPVAQSRRRGNSSLSRLRGPPKNSTRVHDARRDAPRHAAPFYGNVEDDSELTRLINLVAHRRELVRFGKL